MSQRAALILSIALTVLVLLAGTGLAIRAIAASTDAPDDEQTSASATVADDLVDGRLSDAIEQLQRSNDALAHSYERINALLDEVHELEQQNATLREREAQYQNLLAEAGIHDTTLDGVPAVSSDEGTATETSRLAGDDDAHQEQHS